MHADRLWCSHAHSADGDGRILDEAPGHGGHGGVEERGEAFEGREGKLGDVGGLAGLCEDAWG